MAILGMIVALVVVLGILVKMLDLKRRREAEAIVVQAQVTDAILTDPAFLGVPVTPTAHVPLLKGSPVTVEVAGRVPSEELRQTALRLVEREALRVRRDVRVESRMAVEPRTTRRVA